MTLFTKEYKDRLVHRAREAMRGALDLPDDATGLCLHATHFLAQELHREGLEVRIQAGTLSWRMASEEEDDGNSPTHFTYQWSPHSPASLVAAVVGALPEMHVWAALVDPLTIIDISTGQLREHCEAMGGRWTAADPPDYLWAELSDPFEFDAIYTPEPAATRLAVRCLWEQYRPAYLPSGKIRFTERLRVE